MATGKTHFSFMKKETAYIIYTIIGFIGGFIGGFIIGRQNSEFEQSIKYVKGETIEKTIEIPIPYRVEVSAKPIYLYKEKDTIYSTATTEIDTAAILQDWITRRSYQQDLFDNQYGKLSVDASVQYNKLASLKYSFTPLQKEITKTKYQTWMPYVAISYSTLNYIGIGGGLFYHNLGIEYQFQKDFRYNDTGHSLGLKYKF